MHGDLVNNSSTTPAARSSQLRMLDIASLLNSQQSSVSNTINSDIIINNQSLISANSAKQLFDIGNNSHHHHQRALHGMLSHATGLNSIGSADIIFGKTNPNSINCTTNYNTNNSSITANNTAAVNTTTAGANSNNNIEGGDRLSALTNMSNITSASGEASASTSEERGTTTGHGGGVSVQQQQQQGAAAVTAAAMAAAAGLNSNGLSVVVKRKRNLPGTPDPDAEVIALSPKTLMATNRFVCEICNKGFQRDQNLQLHRRGHNLPWKLKQRTNKEIRKRVYICPEPSCVHHDPARALGDLTGIKKHYCRKHGEKKWKCDKCSKRYAVQSDWKAHSKTCGTREYRCDCGTLFSRRDSFITHRAFCDALAEESARVNTGVPNHMLPGGAASLANLAGVGPLGMMSAPPPQSPRGGVPGSASLAARFAAGAANAMDPLQSAALRCGLLSNPEASSLFNHNSSSSSRPRLSLWLGNPGSSSAANHDQFGISSANDHAAAVLGGSHPMDNFGGLGMGSIFDSYEGPKPVHLGGQLQPGHFNSNAAMALMQQPSSNALLPDLSGLSSDYGALSSFAALNRPVNPSVNPNSTQMAPSSVSSLFNQNNNNAANSTASAQMSATALLQKAAQMGATASNNSILKGLGAMEAGNCPWPDRAAGMQVNAMAALHNQFNSMQQQQDRSSAIQFGNKLDSPMGANSDGTKNLDQNCSIQEMFSAASMATSNAGLMSNNMPAMNRNLFGDHQSSPFHTRPHDLSGQQRSALNGQMQSMGQQMQGSMNPRVPKSEDGITRDFLGVRGVNGPLLGGHHQDHQAQLAAMARSVQQQSNEQHHHHHHHHQQQQQQQQQQQHHQHHHQREQFFYSNPPMDHHHFNNNNNVMSKDHHNSSLRTSSPSRSSWDHHGP